MNYLLWLGVCLAGAPPAADAAATRSVAATEVYRCDFEAADDINFDRWPDGWTRRREPGFPRYLPIYIVNQAETEGAPPAPAGEQWLRIELDGGAAEINSPPIAVSSRYSYHLTASVRTEGLQRHAAFLSLTLYDAQSRPVERYTSGRLTTAPDWTVLHIGPLAATHADAATAVIGLHLESGQRGDLTGAALFDDVRLARLPRMTLRANSPFHTYFNPRDVVITCEVSGLHERDPEVTFELVDESHQRLAEARRRLAGDVTATERMLASSLLARGRTAVADGAAESPQQSFSGVGQWSPPIDDYGFYRVRVTMPGEGGVVHERTISLAVLRPRPTPRGGLFGWTLPDGELPLGFGPLASLLEQGGVSWVKFPVWYSDQNAVWADRFAWFAEQLNSSNIRLVGMLDQPPDELRSLFGDADRLTAAALFQEPDLWRPLIDPVMTRLSLNVRFWQLGADDDTSFVGHRDLEPKIRDIKSQLERFGQEIELGICWRWLDELPGSARPPWAFLSMTQGRDPFDGQPDPSFTGAELQAQLNAKPPGGVRQWAMLEPLPRSQYSTETRTFDLVQRMLASSIGGADAVFVPRPFDDEHGLMTPTGAPSELLPAWRTTALMLAGAHRIGSLELPGGSPNHVFVKNDEAFLVVWNDQPTREVIYLGERVAQLDLWDRERPVTMVAAEHGPPQQAIEVGRLPTFIVGVDARIARWMMSCDFEQAKLASQFGRPQAVALRFGNTFPQGASGRATLVAPDVWEVDNRTLPFKLAAGDFQRDAYQVVLKHDASSGPQRVRVDFEVMADRKYEFSVYRTLQVGLGDVELEIVTRLDEQNRLIVEQTMINNSDSWVNFNCLLFAPNRRRQRQPVTQLAPGRVKSTFILPQGDELIGETLFLRAEEFGGSRILNYRFTAEP